MLRLDPLGAADARFALIGAVLGSVWVTFTLRLWIRITSTFTWDDGTCLFSVVSIRPGRTVFYTKILDQVGCRLSAIRLSTILEMLGCL